MTVRPSAPRAGQAETSSAPGGSDGHQSADRRFSVLRFGMWLVWFTGLFLLTLLSGGLLHLAFLETPAPRETTGERLMAGVAFATVLVPATAFCGLTLARRHGRTWLFSTILFSMIAGTTIVAAEITARMFVPPWPARSLHGVAPGNGPHPWMGENPALDKATGEQPFTQNGWGQRDLPREIRPVESTFRIAFVGDSFLEEGAGSPLPLTVEHQLGRDDVEVLNLGVSATAPDEYYYRIRHVALPLRADLCVLCLYTGNDLASVRRTLPGVLGVVAVAPRQSLFSNLGLAGLNHILTNRWRPVLQAWHSAGNLLQQERELHHRFQHSSDAEAGTLLLNLSPAMHMLQSQQLRERLQSEELHAFFELLRHPDRELFRSYFLPEALWLASGGQPVRGDEISIETARHWVLQSFGICHENGTAFLVVIIPEGFEVDARMREQWSPLADMRGFTSGRRQAVERLAAELRSLGVDVLDLHADLKDIRGTYLNLDGHWSRLGTREAARAVTRRLQKWLN